MLLLLLRRLLVVVHGRQHKLHIACWHHQQLNCNSLLTMMCSKDICHTRCLWSHSIHSNTCDVVWLCRCLHLPGTLQQMVCCKSSGSQRSCLPCGCPWQAVTATPQQELL